MPIFVARYFGVTQLGTLTGTIAMLHQMGGGLGAYVGGVIFDSFNSYHWAFVLAFAMSLAGTITTLLLRDDPVPQTA